MHYLGGAIVLACSLSDVAGFCPAGFDDEDDSGVELLMRADGKPFEKDDSRWKCAVKKDSVGNILFDADCINEVEAGFGGTGTAPSEGQEEEELGQICDWYWGNDEGEDGHWDRMMGEHGAMYWDCYASAKSVLVNQWGSETIKNWPEDRWHQARFSIDKKCISSEVCELEHSSQGWCSDFYLEKVQADCGPEDSYRKKYCSQICPRKVHKESPNPPPLSTKPPWQTKPSKCPVKRAAIVIKDKAKEIGSTAWKMFQSFMPALLMPPEPVSSTDARSVGHA